MVSTTTPGKTLSDKYREARELAIFGMYEESKRKYNDVLKEIQDRTVEAKPHGEAVGIWQKCSDTMRQELDLVDNLINAWDFKKPAKAGGRRTPPPYRGHTNSTRDKGQTPSQKNSSRLSDAEQLIEEWGGPNDRDEHVDRLLEEMNRKLGNDRKENAPARKPGRSLWEPPEESPRGPSGKRGQSPEKDPDVWSPPPRARENPRGGDPSSREFQDFNSTPVVPKSSPRMSNQQPVWHQKLKPSVSSQRVGGGGGRVTPPPARGGNVGASKQAAPRSGGGQSSSRPSAGRDVPRGGEGRRGYEKPWLKDESKDEKRGGQRTPPESGGGSKEESAFLLNMYPNGHGPDADLIRGLESTIFSRRTEVKFSDIAGLGDAIKLLRESVVWPQKLPGFFVGVRRPWKGVLLYGPPGTGKTSLAKACATECETAFMNVSVSSLASKYRGEGEKMIRLIFEMARFYAPTTIFIDEIDAIAGSRGGDKEHEASRKEKTELLTQMDGASSAPAPGEPQELVFVLAATNRPWDLDEGIRRRLEKRIHVPLPDAAARKKSFEIAFQELKILPDVDVEQLVDKTEGYSCADITNIVRDASYRPLRRKMEDGLVSDEVLAAFNAGGTLMQEYLEMCMEDLVESLKSVPKSVGGTDLQKFMDWDNEFGTKF